MAYDLDYTLAPFNINVNVIVPGLIRTAFYDRLVGPMKEEDKDAFFAGLANMVPLKRIGTPEDIAGAAQFLASRLGSYVTGASIYVSGGMPLSAQT
jgi:NAD(P)-dependent dehydrogenase (short-subunit alcohol dehydrogenase family)